MKILFLTIAQIHSLEEQSIHLDLIKALQGHGHDVAVLCTREKRLNLPTEFVTERGVKILRLRVGNLTKCSTIQKGINTLRIESWFIQGIKKYYNNEKFDLVIYNTPPITLANVVVYCKKRFGCKSYLMLKDIFPQNAVDIGMMRTGGVTGLLYRLFRKKEIKLYRVSDRIGCMSEANKRYVLQNNPFVKEENVEIFPNAVLPDTRQEPKNRKLLEKYGIGSDEVTFVYGGNLGKPQGLDFLAEAILRCQSLNCRFVIVGSGTEKERLFETLKPCKNVVTLSALPHDEYERLCAACDVGILALDYRFTIPNYPSRSLSYMSNAMPILACTDKATDIKELVEQQAQCGKWCYSNDVEAFRRTVEWFLANRDRLEELGARGRAYLEEHFTTNICVQKLERFCAE